MISLRDIRKVYPTRFGENLVLDGISFDLGKGEKLGVLGRNGAGKSTMVRLMSGAERPTSGTISRSMSVSWPLAFGGAFQPFLTGVDNIKFISRIYAQDAAHNLAFVEDFAELGRYLHEPVRTYSSGMRARLAFAISMIIEFDCFLIDEIGAVGDARFHERCNRELFQKRGDRAMVIISHDAGYIRDHCQRFAVLHNGKLAMYEDFEVAYADFREKIGLETAARSVTQTLPIDRKDLIETAQTFAARDDGFRLLVQEADWRRDEQRWAEAEDAYKKALELFPYQRSYWGQLAHCAREAGSLVRAEVAYRTACSLGEPIAEIEPFLAFTLEAQGLALADHPLRPYRAGAAADEPPGWPDVMLFSRMAWGDDALPDEDILALLRACPSCDALLAAMIEDARFERAQHVWLAQTRAGEMPGMPDATRGDGDKGEAPRWARNLAIVACPASSGYHPGKVADMIHAVQDAWLVVMAYDGFPGWRSARAAIERQMAKAP